jgi:predicted pyridoxine 5'-phosphate oxidase superfamily flavin-nucleotide-binding protein
MSEAAHMPWHEGELAAQHLAGLERTPNGLGIRDFMPDQHRLFFAEQPLLVAATVDETGAPAATLLTGEPGFVASPDPRTLAILARADDPTGRLFLRNAPIGLLGIQPHTRRRNRVNGWIAHAGGDGLLVGVLQSFGNCPQYIREREVAYAPAPAGAAETFDGLDDVARAAVAAADTFFVATASGPQVANGGVDVSHRGGPPGFVAVDGKVLTIPDYRGNRYFNTLGNLLLEPRAALLFVDFAAGTMTQLQGRAEVLWGAHDLPHAERAWRFHVERGWRAPAGVRQVAAAPS